MNAKFRITKNTINNYLDQLQNHFRKKEEDMLKEMMFAATGHTGNKTAPIPRKIMLEGKQGNKAYNYNPWLYMSGQDSSHWTLDIDEEESRVIANYSGMRGANSLEKFKVWVEFSEEFLEEMEYGSTPEQAYAEVRQINPYHRTLARDYALYQETGADQWASPEDANHIGYVNKGMADAAKQVIPYTAKTYLRRIVELRY